MSDGGNSTMDCGSEAVCIVGWTLFSVVVVVLLVTLAILAHVYKRCRALRREVEKRKKVDLEISNPINTQRCFSPWEARATAEGRKVARDQQRTTAHMVGGGAPEGGGGADNEEEEDGAGGGGEHDLRDDRENEELEGSQSGSYIRGSQVGIVAPSRPRAPGKSGGGGGGSGGGEGVELQQRETSGSIVSERYDYVENRDRWVSRGGKQQQKQQHPRTVTLPLAHQTVPGEGGNTRPESTDILDDYVHMNSVTAGNQYLRLVGGLAQVPEDADREKEEGGVWEALEDPADYEHPVLSERGGDRPQRGRGRPGLHRKGDALVPALSGAVASGGAGMGHAVVIPTKRYMNIDVREYDPSMALFCSSEHHRDTPTQSQPPATKAAGEPGNREKASKKHPEYINIDGESLPPESPPAPKNSQ